MRRRAALLGACLLLAACQGAGHPAGSAPVRVEAAPAPSSPVTAPTGRTAQQVEEARPGTPSWRLLHRDVATDAQLSAFADHVSVLPGTPVRLFSSSTAPSFVVRAYRMGWYGGARAREVWHSAAIAGRTQSARVVSAATGAVSVHWTPTLTVPTTGWVPGMYLLRFDTSVGTKRFVPLVVRSASTRGAVVLVSAVNTWQAYNTWGSRDLYRGDDGARRSRSRAVSFDRPWYGNGAEKYSSYEDGLVHEAAHLGVPLAYETDLELDHDPHLLDGARGVVTMGHSEYWTPAMMAHLKAARDRGTNLAFLGANTAYWRVRYAPTALGTDRLMIGYKSVDDPIRATHPEQTTVRFRDSPVPVPENTLTGELYECFPAQGDFVVSDPSFFLFAGTGVARGSRVTGLIGPEADRAYPIVSTPHPLQVVADSPTRCGTHSTRSTASYYSTPSGAGVFTVGTMRWITGLRGSLPKVGFDASGQRFVRAVTDNLLRAMSGGPMGRSHPARDNLAAHHLGATNTTGAA